MGGGGERGRGYGGGIGGQKNGGAREKGEEKERVVAMRE